MQAALDSVSTEVPNVWIEDRTVVVEFGEVTEQYVANITREINWILTR